MQRWRSITGIPSPIHRYTVTDSPVYRYRFTGIPLPIHRYTVTDSPVYRYRFTGIPYSKSVQGQIGEGFTLEFSENMSMLAPKPIFVLMIVLNSIPLDREWNSEYKETNLRLSRCDRGNWEKKRANMVLTLLTLILVVHIFFFSLVKIYGWVITVVVGIKSGVFACIVS
jgi:hypothetical protein